MLVAITSPLVWISKNLCYESPYCVKGTIMLTGSERAPKDICIDRIVGTWKGIRHSNVFTDEKE